MFLHEPSSPVPAEYRFYHSQGALGIPVLVKLLSVCLERGWKVVIKVEDDVRSQHLCDELWMYDDHSFLPHGNSHDGHEAEQPIWITCLDENPNRAEVLFLLDTEDGHAAGLEPGALGFTMVCCFFDGQDHASLARARARWTALEGAMTSGERVYLQQSPQGWQRGAHG